MLLRSSASCEPDGYPFFLDDRMQAAAGEGEEPTLNDSDKDMISETRIVLAPEPIPAPRTNTRRPTSKMTTSVPYLS